MPEMTPSPDGRVRNPEVHREHSDASLKWILGIVGGSVVVLAVILAGLRLVFNGWQSRLDEDRQPRFSLAPGPAAGPPPEPRLEQIDRLAGVDPHGARMSERLDRLHRYGPSADKGYVQVPIDRAIEQLQGKLPARPEPSAKESRRSEGLIDAGEPNSGRLFRKGER